MIKVAQISYYFENHKSHYMVLFTPADENDYIYTVVQINSKIKIDSQQIEHLSSGLDTDTAYNANTRLLKVSNVLIYGFPQVHHAIELLKSCLPD